MLKIILLGYSHGLVSSGKIATACETNILFMSLSGDVQPHYTSVASFVARMSEQIAPLFTQVLMICDEEGLIARNMFAIDGCKIKSNASKEWSGTFAELERKQLKLKKASQGILERHQSQDDCGEEQIEHDLKQKAKLDRSAAKIADYRATKEQKYGSKGKPRRFSSADFHYDEKDKSCRCPAGNIMWCSGDYFKSGERLYISFVGYLKDCKACPSQSQCMGKAPLKIGRQVQFKTIVKKKNYRIPIRCA